MANPLFDRLIRAVYDSLEATALVVFADNGERSLTFRELAAAAERTARALIRRGLEPGDRVAIYAPSGADYAIALLGALRAGAMLVPINSAYRRREIAHILADATPRLFLVGDAERAAVEEISEDEVSAFVGSVVALEDLRSEKLEQGGAHFAHSPSSRAIDRSVGDPALMLYTSGTTGKSKGAELSHGNVVAMIEALHSAWEWSAADRLLLTLPLFHLHGLVVGLFTALSSGARVLLEPRFDAARVVDRLARGEATLFFGVPTLYVRLVDELSRRNPRVDLSAVRLFVSGSAPLAPETFHAFRKLTGQTILERYGMSETGMLLSNPLHGTRIAGSVGTPLPGVEARLVDRDGRPVAAGGEGEIEVRGPSVFRSYRNAPGKTAESFRPPAAKDRDRRPWFRTGDLARVEPASGHYFLLGRASELILSGGFNVYPREIEEVLLAFPGVREAAVVGEKHPEFGESPVAFLVTEGELDDRAIAALSAHCRAELAAFKLPRRFVRVEALPRNAMGKVEKRRLLAGPA